MSSTQSLEIQICSDIHIEFGYDTSDVIIPKAKYLALLGDTGVVKYKDGVPYRQFLLTQAERFERVFVIPGMCGWLVLLVGIVGWSCWLVLLD
jgi:hypothetical protein